MIDKDDIDIDVQLEQITLTSAPMTTAGTWHWPVATPPASAELSNTHVTTNSNTYTYINTNTHTETNSNTYTNTTTNETVSRSLYLF